MEEQRGKAGQVFQSSLERVSKPIADDVYQKALQRRVEADQPSFNQRTLLPGQGDSSNAVKAAIVQSQDKGIESTRQAAKDKAALEAYGDVAFDQGIDLNRNAQKIDQYGNFAKGAFPVLGKENAAANFAGDDNFLAADAIGSLGHIGGRAYDHYAGPKSTTLKSGEVVNWKSNRFGVPYVNVNSVSGL